MSRISSDPNNAAAGFSVVTSVVLSVLKQQRKGFFQELVIV